jgi:hypothetical protein
MPNEWDFARLLTHACGGIRKYAILGWVVVGSLRSLRKRRLYKVYLFNEGYNGHEESDMMTWISIE